MPRLRVARRFLKPDASWVGKSRCLRVRSIPCFVPLACWLWSPALFTSLLFLPPFLVLRTVATHEASTLAHFCIFRCVCTTKPQQREAWYSMRYGVLRPPCSVQISSCVLRTSGIGGLHFHGYFGYATFHQFVASVALLIHGRHYRPCTMPLLMDLLVL